MQPAKLTSEPMHPLTWSLLTQPFDSFRLSMSVSRTFVALIILLCCRRWQGTTPVRSLKMAVRTRPVCPCWRQRNAELRETWERRPKHCQELALKDGALSEAGTRVIEIYWSDVAPESTKARCLHSMAKHFGPPGQLHWLASLCTDQSANWSCTILASGNVELCHNLVFSCQHPGKERPHLGKERHTPPWILFWYGGFPKWRYP